ncbi:Pkinase-domain-containing protein [Mycena pura]|uniref:non-specific serine/threonine protein kinase n=1 Tax=Mycena pura TaxID=153505 RepID=A0AAD7E3Q9_9AGAR|nr:Pkinase-domain-containing protein [Mycena pura]
MAPHAYDVTEIPPPRLHKPKRSNRVLGDYTLSKTLGAGSMGKVKLATHNVTGEEFAVKILPRALVTSQSSSKEAGKEIRTLREAGLSLLLHHPYICSMREMIVHPNHYYMVFEYVNGGQLLDFIIAHGRLRESVARKFARQIASALTYCHRNNVVHRDLKIENILISQTGNIKIIDFGLSNLYNPAAHLSTFCGSLYFAAPELLNAKLYTGPEVDIWSFGVVLYTLVCGKVPFEDESMPALHAKIKRGLVEYPVWLSPECKHLLSRMLVINPLRRAPLSEIASHPWMLRGFTAPPAPHLPARVPLRLADLDPAVVQGMAGFDFGADVEEVLDKLRAILESDEYMHAVLAWEHQRNGHAPLELHIPSSISSTSVSPPSPSPSDTAKRRRFSGLDLYRRIFAATPPPVSPTAPPVPPPRDPTGGFHPLISMYLLAREKLERERIYGANVFASSQVSLGSPSEKVPENHGAVAVPLERVKAERQKAEADADAAAYRRDGETDQERGPVAVTSLPPPPPTPPLIPEMWRGARGTGMNGVSPPANGISDTHKDHPETVVVNAVANATPRPRSDTPQTEQEAAPPPPAPTEKAPATQPVAADEVAEVAVAVEVKEVKPEPEPQTTRERRPRQSTSGGTGLLRRFGSILLGTDRHDGGGTLRRRPSSKRKSILTGTVRLPPKDDHEERRPEQADEKAVEATTAPSAPSTAPDPPSPAAETSSPTTVPTSSNTLGRGFGSVRRRAATLLDPAARAARHERRSSTGGSILTTGGGTVGRHRRPSLVGYETATLSKADRVFPTTVPEGDMLERPEEVFDFAGARDGHTDAENEGYVSEKGPKPVLLKGLFSVATTSTKPAPVIKADIRRVLDRMQVRYWQNKTGFECIHVPSINAPSIPPPDSNAAVQSFPSSGDTTVAAPRNGITRRVSRLSFSVRRVKSQERDFPFARTRDADTSARALAAMMVPPPNGVHRPLVVPDVLPSVNNSRPTTAVSVDVAGKPPSILSTNSRLRSIHSDVTPGDAPMSQVFDPLSSGEMDRVTFETMAHNALSVRFEINVVKVPWLPLHGIQFRRAGGDGWQYQMLARRVLTELKL